MLKDEKYQMEKAGKLYRTFKDFERILEEKFKYEIYLDADYSNLLISSNDIRLQDDFNNVFDCILDYAKKELNEKYNPPIVGPATIHHAGSSQVEHLTYCISRVLDQDESDTE